MNFKDFVKRMQRKGNVILLDVFFWMKLILIFSLSVLPLYYEIEIVNRSNNVLMSLIDVLISVFSSVEFVVDRMVSVVLVFMWLYVFYVRAKNNGNNLKLLFRYHLFLFISIQMFPFSKLLAPF